MSYVNDMLDFIYQSPTSFQATDTIKKELLAHGFIEFNEANNVKIEKGKNYFVTRNQTSVIAFKVGKNLENPSFNVVASHTDCPGYKVKPNALIKSNGYVKLNTEGYGGMIRSSWLDKPLSLAGRVLLNTEKGIESRLVNIDEDLMVIPSVAIHLSRDEQGKLLNQQTDMLPVISMDENFDFKEFLASKINEDVKDIISFDLYLYPHLKGFIFNDLLGSHHLDNLECAYTSLQAFFKSYNDDTINFYVSFDSEEVGSRTRQGAASTFLKDIIEVVSKDLNINSLQAMSNSLFVSADNAHAIHPNHPEKTDPVNHVKMNNGIVIKYNANQSYTSDALSSALFIKCIEDVPYQYFTNRSDLVGGGTLGAISTSQISFLSVDIGLAQLAMHSTTEVAGVKDVENMINGLEKYYNSHIVKVDESNYEIKKR